MNKQTFKVLQILVTIGLLAFVFYQVGLFSEEGRDQFYQTLKGANIFYLLLCIGVGVLINMCSALKWWMLIRSQKMHAGYWRVFSYYLIGQFYNLFLPTSVGGDVVRAYELGKHSGRQADAVASVFVERYTGVLTLLALAGAAVLLQLSKFNVDFIIVSLVLFTIGLGFIAWMLFDSRVYAFTKSAVIRLLPMSKGVFIKLDKLIASLGRFAQDPSALTWAFVNSMVFYFIAVLNVWLTAMVFQVDVSFWHMLAATPIIMLIMNIPLSLGNIGLMEFAYSSVLVLMGYEPALGLSVAILMRLKSLFDGAMGGLLAPIFVTQKHE
ncbi:MAG: hypothetical protein ACI9FR_000829 [Cryomorphaceae bacterium]